jgi:hypothetical protein
MAFISLNPSTRNFGIWLLAENNPVELLTFIFLLFGSIYGFSFSFKSRKSHEKYVSIFFGVFSIFLIFIAMEEIAWGQHIFHFETPSEWKKINLQGETTIHNLSGLQGKSEIFRFIYGIGGITGIILSKYSFFSKISPVKILWSWFFIILIHSSIDIFTDIIKINEFYDKGIQRTSELIELLIAISAVLYLWLNRIKLMRI